MIKTSFEQISLQLSLDGFSDQTRETIHTLIQNEITHKLDNAVKKYLEKLDAVGVIKIALRKVDGKFSGSFSCLMDKYEARYERENFVNLNDLIVHAFDHLKQEFLKK